MMTRPARVTLLAATVLLTATAAGAADSRSCDGWCVDLIDTTTGEPLRLERAGYVVEVYGAVVTGRLEHEFTNDAAAGTAELRWKAPADVRLDTIEHEVAGVTETAFERESASREAPRGRGASAATPKQTGPVQVRLEADQSVMVRSTFTFQLPLKAGRLTLTLPAIRTAAGGGENGAAYSYRVDVIHDEPLGHAESSTHEVFVDFLGDRSSIELAAGEEFSSREFALEFALGREDEATLLAHAGRESDGVREVLAVITPPSRPREGSSRPKQMLFVLDTSGSMGKDAKLNQARDAMYASLEKLTAQDAFNIVEFDGEFTLMAEAPLVATEETLAEAREWLRTLRPGGNTKLMPALSAAIEQPEDTRRHEMIVLLTDGAVQDPAQVERMLREELGQGRLFLVGIGEDVKRENILRFAEVGRGTAVFATDPKALDASLARLFDQISEPLFWDIELNVGSAKIESMEPSRIPDLYGGRSVTVRVRLKGELPEALQVSGETMDGPRTYSTPLRQAP